MRALALALLLLVPGLGRAADYVAAAGSTLDFRVDFQGEAVEGRFARFTPTIRFDPAHLENSRFDVAIDLAGATTRNPDGDELLHGADFFAVARTPQARFTATRLRALGGDRYAADGELSLRGVRKPVTLAFRWTGGARPVLEGQAKLKRLDFGVGLGEWADPETLGNEVTVSTRLVLVPAPAKAAAPTAKPAAPPAATPKPAKPASR